jgi:5-methylcytosine-specific restriction endonuclease McrA
MHPASQTDRVTTYYPDHPPRVATNVYIRSHHELIVKKNLPCWACGITHTDCVHLKDVLKGVAMETHHFWTEDAFTGEGGGLGGIFWPRVQADHGDFDWANSGFDIDDPKTYKYFVDSVYNLQVLCSQCHRAAKPVVHWMAGKKDHRRGDLVWPHNAGSMGIHHASYPVYRDQRHSRPDTPPFQTVLEERIMVPPHELLLADDAAEAEAKKTPMQGHMLISPTGMHLLQPI